MTDSEKVPLTFYVVRWLVGFLAKIYLRHECHGIEQVPRTGGCIIACNHVSFLDPPLLGSSVRHRIVRFMARDTLFKPGFSSWLMHRLCTVPISRDRGDVGALRKGIQFLKKGECLGLFPEGTRSPTGELQEAKGGIGFLIAKASVPVVPAYVDGSYRAYSKKSRWIKPVKTRLFLGKPITVEELAAIPDDDQRYENVGRLVMDRIRALRDANATPAS